MRISGRALGWVYVQRFSRPLSSALSENFFGEILTGDVHTLEPEGAAKAPRGDDLAILRLCIISLFEEFVPSKMVAIKANFEE